MANLVIFALKEKAMQVIAVQLRICLFDRPELLQENIRLEQMHVTSVSIASEIPVLLT